MTGRQDVDWAAVCVTAAIERTFGADVTAEVMSVPQMARFVVLGHPRVLVPWTMLWQQTAETVAWYVAARMGLSYEDVDSGKAE